VVARAETLFPIVKRHTVRAKSDAKVLLLGGEPTAEPVVGHGPFRMNTTKEVQRSIENHQLGGWGAGPKGARVAL